MAEEENENKEKKNNSEEMQAEDDRKISIFTLKRLQNKKSIQRRSKDLEYENLITVSPAKSILTPSE